MIESATCTGLWTTRMHPARAELVGATYFGDLEARRGEGRRRAARQRYASRLALAPGRAEIEVPP